MSYEETLTRLRQSGNFRTIPAAKDANDTVVDLSSNDYLGLAARTDLRDEFFSRIAGEMPALSASASRLLAADQRWHEQLESRLAAMYGRHVLLFNSGYHANTGLLSALASEPSTLILADRLVHASMIDGIVLSRAPFKRFPHNDFDRLETILKKEAGEYDRIIVAVESVYSMDGDRADLKALVELKRRYPNVILYIDEAHAFGAKGRDGLGLVASMEEMEEVDIIVGTFGKAAASVGAFCAVSPTIRDYAVNRARTHLQLLEDTLHESLASLPEDARMMSHSSHIVPYIVGDASATLRLSARLLEEGFKGLPIRTPTVPPGTERLRISLSAALTTDQIKNFANALSTACK